MRTHFLKDLKISDKNKLLQFLPGFDFYRLQKLIGLRWECVITADYQKTISNLEMTLGYESEVHEKAEITLRFVAVVRCRLPELLPMVYFSEIEVEDLSDAQLEGIRYSVKSYGTTDLKIECKDIEIANFRMTSKCF